MHKTNKDRSLVSIVILRYKKLEDTLIAIDSATDQTYSNCEIIVVDDASPDDSPQAIKEKYPNVKLIRLKKSMGRSAHNIGLKEAVGEILIPIDADMYFPKNFVRKVVEKFDRYPDVSFIAPNLIHPTEKAFQWVPVHERLEAVKGGYDCAGGLPFMRKRAFGRVGGFNPDIFLYVDEWEHLIRIWRAGYRVVYFPDLVMYHTYSNNPYRSIMMGYHTVVNHIQLYAMYLPIRIWPKFLFHHTGQFSNVVVTGKANRLGTIKGLLLGVYYFLKALPKRQVLDNKTLNIFTKYYFPKKGKVIVEKWGWK
ncbi:hypothetical protein A2961_00180 [Candidatus Woesebacteria bacterium RIFCSPLOWO2_01_FULL_39_21]|uniref:Glycosyltransferase 2-like domain-containing protein n=1 Tax=Candidatus Woesebacteria bacterium RIFCSPLOWO2_01_FULL_39_21 TaxID=1802519 RepID=A0A1F8BJP2_9BACT|nr:MAG: hypothetical protein A2691_01030 [Candidatus Woesebacteria bacterium RIFCSPHIGHO2_01_FULL_39_23]OGM64294.1 MAG: hypothetical protein A2961_00180 [Candidatus Woesebacteria bacterium RIFCSPLOWO2_01_FULL_39_21]